MKMIDIHSHILPSIDDGSKNMENTIEMLQMASKNGITKMVATSHFYRGYFENKYEDICKLLGEVKAVIIEKGMDVDIFPGQEVFLDKYTLEFYKAGIVGCINSSRYMLVEFDMESKPKEIFNILYELKILGVVPIIAHPERYAYILENPIAINEFIQERYLLQINSGSITGIFGKTVQKTAEKLITNGTCHFIASDAHSTGRRCPSIKEALDVADKLNNEISSRVMENAQKILENEDIEYTCEKLKEKKSIFSFLRK